MKLSSSLTCSDHTINNVSEEVYSISPTIINNIVIFNPIQYFKVLNVIFIYFFIYFFLD